MLEKPEPSKCNFPGCGQEFVNDVAKVEHVQITGHYSRTEPQTWPCTNCGTDHEANTACFRPAPSSSPLETPSQPQMGIQTNDVPKYKESPLHREAVEEIMDCLGLVAAMNNADGRDKALQPNEVASIEAILRRIFPIPAESSPKGVFSIERWLINRGLRTNDVSATRETLGHLLEAFSAALASTPQRGATKEKS